jgi:hypothetical protein
MTFPRAIVPKPPLLAAVRKIGNEMTKHPKRVCAGFALALVLAIGVHPPAVAEASAESQELAQQLVQRAGLKKLAMLSMRAHFWAQVDGEPIDPGPSTLKDRYFFLYECLRDKDGAPFEAPLAKLLAVDLTPEDIRGLLEFYAGPVGNEAVQQVLWTQHQSLGLPRTGEYASFLSPPRISSAQQAAVTHFISSERFVKMMKPLTQTTSGYSSAMGELIRQCDELSIPAPQNTVTKPSYPAVGRGGIQYPEWIVQGIVPATVKTSARPAYPAIAKRLGIQGSMHPANRSKRGCPGGGLTHATCRGRQASQAR